MNNEVYMSNLIIKYKIDEYNPDISDVSELEGGIYVQYDNTILTKPIDYESDGYIGNFLFYEIWDWIGGIPDLINNKKIKVKILESFIAFRFVLKDDFVYFSIVNDTLNEDMLKGVSGMYPGGVEGYPIPIRPFLNESVEMGKKFLNDIKNKYPHLDNTDGLKGFMKTLKEVEEFVKMYNRTHKLS